MKRILMAVAAMSLGLGLAAVDAQAAQPKAASTMAAKPAAKPSLYSRAQAKLKDLGDYAGAVNGKRDNATISAIKKFQTAQKLKVSGRLTPETVKALGV
jgi:peptidoglycan hydrolase-like protein with peptidoglycan-binding domain